MPVRVCHVITGLEMGGAESMLAKLCEALPRDRIESSVVALRGGGPLASRIRNAETHVDEIGLRPGRLPGPRSLLRVREAIRRSRADVVQGWMYHANLASTASRPGVPVIWNVRQTLYDMRRERRLTRLVIRASAWLSALPDAILYNSLVAARQHEAAGFRADRTTIVPNGFDVSRFAPSAQARDEVRSELGLAPSAPLVGLIARAHPMKDHEMFLDAATRIAETNPDVHFLLVGEGTESIGASISSMDLKRRVRALGARADIPRLTASLDVACSASAWGEGFPNVLGEALASGVPCVATDVGDSAEVIGGAGRVVPPRDPAAFAAAVSDLLSDAATRRRLGEAGRDRILNNYALGTIADRYADLYERVAASSSR